MNELCIVEDAKSESMGLARIDLTNSIELFKPNGCDPIIEYIRKEVDSFIPTIDISTADGQRKVNSFARKIGASKTAVDDAGKKLVADQKAALAAIDSERKRLRDELDLQRNKVLAPLRKWQDEDEKRKEGHEAALLEIHRIKTFAVAPIQKPSSEAILAKIAELEPYRTRAWEEFGVRAERDIETTDLTLRIALSDAEKREAADAAAEQERIAQEIQARKDREAKIARDAAEKAEQEAKRKADELAAKVRAEQEAAEQARINAVREAEEAAERAKQAEIQKETWRVNRHKGKLESISYLGEPDSFEGADSESIKSMLRSLDRDESTPYYWEEFAELAKSTYDSVRTNLKDAMKLASANEAIKASNDLLAVERRAKEAADVAVETERKRVANQKAKDDAAAAKLAANKRHREKVEREACNAIKEAMSSCIRDESEAGAVLRFIRQGKVPHVTINY